jgi:outer membrane protein
MNMRTRTLLFAIMLLAAGFTTQAQTPQKIGYADWEYIFTQMPEAKQIDAELKTHGTQLENQLKAKTAEFETKYKAYQAMPVTTSDIIKADKERELQMMQESIQKFQQDAQTSIQKKQGDLMTPVFTKVGKAIEEVAKENGYSFIINPQLGAGSDILLYSDEKYDISDLVLKKMGVTPQPAVQKTN